MHRRPPASSCSISRSSSWRLPFCSKGNPTCRCKCVVLVASTHHPAECQWQRRARTLAARTSYRRPPASSCSISRASSWRLPCCSKCNPTAGAGACVLVASTHHRETSMLFETACTSHRGPPASSCSISRSSLWRLPCCSKGNPTCRCKCVVLAASTHH